MNPTIEQLLRVQEVDTDSLFIQESLRLRPLELDDDRKKVEDTQRALEALETQVKQMRVDSDRREVDVKKSDQEIEKFNIALNQARSNQEYTIIQEQIKRQEQIRGNAEEEVLGILATIDTIDEERRVLRGRLAAETKALDRKAAEVREIVQGLEGQLEDLRRRRAELVDGVNHEHLKIYERVLARHNNFAIARVESQVCQGCYMSVTANEVNFLMQGQFVQCRSCSRILYLAD